MICDFNDTAYSTRDICVQYERGLGGGGEEGGGGGGGGVEGGALLVLLAQEDELLLGWLPLISLLLYIMKIYFIKYTGEMEVRGVCEFCFCKTMHLAAETKPHQLTVLYTDQTPHLLIIFLASDCINNLNLGVIM